MPQDFLRNTGKSSGALEIDEEAMGVEVNSVKNANAGFAAEDISFVGTSTRQLKDEKSKQDDFAVGLRSDVIRAQRLQAKRATGVKDATSLEMQIYSDDESKASAANTSGGGRGKLDHHARQNPKNSTAQMMTNVAKRAQDPKFKPGDDLVDEVAEMEDEDFESDSGMSAQGPTGGQTGLTYNQ